MTIDPSVKTQVARAELMKRVLIVVIAVIVSAVLIAELVVLSAVRSTQKEGSPTLQAISSQQDDIETAANSASRLLELVLECFDPKSKCARDSAAREAEQAGAYNAAVIAAQFCVGQVLPATYTLEELTHCVGDILEGRSS